MANKSTKRRRFKKQPKTVALPELCPLAPKQDALGLFLLFVGTFLLFALSTSRTVMLEDDGLFIAAAYTLGVGHPPGYPLYTLLGWIFSHVPISSVAWRVHALSGAFGALTCVCIAYLVIRRTGYRPAAYLAGAILAVSDHFWSQSLVADVYTANTALLFLTLVFGQEAVVRKSHHLWIAAVVCYGLGLANHWILLILGSPVLLAWAWIGRRELLRRLRFLIPIVLIVPALLYGWMMYRSQQDPEISFLGPINTLSELISYIRREAFAGTDQEITAGILDKFQYAGYALEQLFIQLTPLGFLIALAGMIYSYRQGWRLGLYAELAALVAGSLLLIAFLGFEYNEFKAGVFRPYVITLYGILALRFGYGLYALKQWADHRFTHLGLISTSSALIIGLFWWNAQVNWRSDDTFARDYAKALLDSVEPNSVLIPHGDAYVFPTAYLHVVEGYRPDIRLLHSSGLLLRDRIVQPNQQNPVKLTHWLEFLQANKQPLYYQSFAGVIETFISGKIHLGYLHKVDTKLQIGTIEVEKNDAGKAFFLQMLAQDDVKNIWINHHRNRFLSSYGSYLGFALASSKPEMHSYIRELLPLAKNNYWTLLGVTSTLAALSDKHIPLAEEYLNLIKAMGIQGDEKADYALVFYLEGLIERNKGNLQSAKVLFDRSIEINPAQDNRAHGAINRRNKAVK